MIIEKGKITDADEIENLYNVLTENFESRTNYSGWKKGIYPIREDAINGLEEGTLFVAREQERIVGSFILSHGKEEVYSKIDWGNTFECDKIIWVYTLAVHPLWQERGIGKRLIEFIIQHGKDMNMKAIRLDVYGKNIPAIALYKKYGFEYIDSVDLGYEGFGSNEFKLYQRLL